MEIVGTTAALTSSSWLSACWRGRRRRLPRPRQQWCLSSGIASRCCWRRRRAHYSGNATLPSLSPSVLHTFKAQALLARDAAIRSNRYSSDVKRKDSPPSRPTFECWAAASGQACRSSARARSGSASTSWLYSGNRCAQATCFKCKANSPTACSAKNARSLASRRWQHANAAAVMQRANVHRRAPGKPARSAAPAALHGVSARAPGHAGFLTAARRLAHRASQLGASSLPSESSETMRKGSKTARLDTARTGQPGSASGSKPRSAKYTANQVPSSATTPRTR